MTKSDFWDNPNLRNDNAKVNDLCDIDPMEIVPSSFVLLLLVKILPLIAAGIYNRRPAARKHTDVSSMAGKFSVCKILCPNSSTRELENKIQIAKGKRVTNGLPEWLVLGRIPTNSHFVVSSHTV